MTFSAVVQAPWGIEVAPILIYRSALPTLTFEGTDINNDSNTNDITARAYKYTGLNDDGTATFEDVGPCDTVNCSRRAVLSAEPSFEQSLPLRGNDPNRGDC